MFHSRITAFPTDKKAAAESFFVANKTLRYIKLNDVYNYVIFIVDSFSNHFLHWSGKKHFSLQFRWKCCRWILCRLFKHALSRLALSSGGARVEVRKKKDTETYPLSAGKKSSLYVILSSPILTDHSLPSRHDSLVRLSPFPLRNSG